MDCMGKNGEEHENHSSVLGIYIYIYVEIDIVFHACACAAQSLCHYAKSTESRSARLGAQNVVVPRLLPFSSGKCTTSSTKTGITGLDQHRSGRSMAHHLNPTSS